MIVATAHSSDADDPKLSPMATKSWLSENIGVRTRGMRKRLLRDISEDQMTMPTELETMSCKKQRICLSNADIMKERSLERKDEDQGIAALEYIPPTNRWQKVSPPNSKIFRDASPSPSEGSQTKLSTDQKSESSPKQSRRTKTQSKLSQAIDRAHSFEIRAQKAESLLIEANEEDPRKGVDFLKFSRQLVAMREAQIEGLVFKGEERDLKMARITGELRAYKEFEERHQAEIAEKNEMINNESALVMTYLKKIVERDSEIERKVKNLEKVQSELNALRTIVDDANGKIKALQATQELSNDTIVAQSMDIETLRVKLAMQSKVLARKKEMIGILKINENSVIRRAIEHIWE